MERTQPQTKQVKVLVLTVFVYCLAFSWLIISLNCLLLLQHGIPITVWCPCSLQSIASLCTQFVVQLDLFTVSEHLCLQLSHPVFNGNHLWWWTLLEFHEFCACVCVSISFLVCMLDLWKMHLSLQHFLACLSRTVMVVELIFPNGNMTYS